MMNVAQLANTANDTTSLESALRDAITGGLDTHAAIEVIANELTVFECALRSGRLQELDDEVSAMTMQMIAGRLEALARLVRDEEEEYREQIRLLESDVSAKDARIAALEAEQSISKRRAR